MSKLDTSGLNKIQKKLEEVDGEHQVSTDDLMTDAFIRGNTRFQTWQELMNAGGIRSSEDIQGSAFSEFIEQNTKFNNFDDLAQAAAAEYITQKLGF